MADLKWVVRGAVLLVLKKRLYLLDEWKWMEWWECSLLPTFDLDSMGGHLALD